MQLSVEIALHWIAEQPDIKAPATMGESFESMAEAGAISTELAERLRKAVGFRNLAGDQPTSNVAGARTAKATVRFALLTGPYG